MGVHKLKVPQEEGQSVVGQGAGNVCMVHTLQDGAITRETVVPEYTGQITSCRFWLE